MRLLIAQHQLTQTRSTVQNSIEPVLIADAQGRVLFFNPSFAELVEGRTEELISFDEVAALFESRDHVRSMLADLRSAHQAWRGEQVLRGAGAGVPVSVRAEAVQGRGGEVLGFMLLFADLRDSKRTEAARVHLENTLSLADTRGARSPDGLMSAILTHANLAAMDIADASGGPSVAPLIEELETSTRRATALYEQIRGLRGLRPGP